MISNSLTLCTNASGINNAQESGGTSGSGATLNRSEDLASPISGYTYLPNVSATQGIIDGSYGIVKNISPRSSTNRAARKNPNCDNAPLPTAFNECDNRMHRGIWEIEGDHTGMSGAVGNEPPAAAMPRQLW